MMPRNLYSPPSLKELKTLKQNSKPLNPSSMMSKDFVNQTNHNTCDAAVFKAALKNKTFGVTIIREILKKWYVEGMGTDVIMAALERAEKNKFIKKEGKQWKSLI